MKLVILGLLACNQTVYDEIYKQLILNVIQNPLTQESINKKNDSIELLRKLCNNQRSSWETK